MHSKSSTTCTARRRTAYRLLAMCLLGAGFISGCWTKHTANPARLTAAPEYPPANAWPPRRRDAMLPLLAATTVEKLEPTQPPTSPATIRKAAPFALAKIDSSPAKTAATPSTQRIARISVVPSNKCGYAAMHGDVLLRLFERDPIIPSEKDRNIDLVNVYGFIPNGRIATSRSFEDPLGRLADENYKGPYIAMLDLLHKERVPFEVSADALISKPEAGVPICIPPAPDSANTSPTTRYKGVLIHLQSLAPNPFEPRVLEEFRKRGWCVVDIATQTTVLPPLVNEAQTLARISDGIKKAQALDDQQLAKIFDSGFDDMPPIVIAGLIGEYQKRAAKTRTKIAKDIAKAQAARAFRIPCNTSPTDDEVDEVAKGIAFQVDNSIAGNAYALEAVLDYLHHQRPDLANLPRVIAGFSAGALVTPTGVARVRERFPISAVVLVGGGVDMFYMSQESTLTDGGLKILCEEKPGSTREVRPTPALLERIHNAYLRHTKLDPIYTTSALRGIPVLQVHAAWDEWVPYEAGEALWEQLDRPERWDLSSLPPLSGHLALFYLLPGKRQDIANWVEKTVFGE